MKGLFISSWPNQKADGFPSPAKLKAERISLTVWCTLCILIEGAFTSPSVDQIMEHLVLCLSPHLDTSLLFHYLSSYYTKASWEIQAKWHFLYDKKTMLLLVVDQLESIKVLFKCKQLHPWKRNKKGEKNRNEINDQKLLICHCLGKQSFFIDIPWDENKIFCCSSKAQLIILAT